MSKYDPRAIEKKWQKIWEEDKAFSARDDTTKEKNYLLIEFPYPSGDGLHVGAHPLADGFGYCCAQAPRRRIRMFCTP